MQKKKKKKKNKGGGGGGEGGDGADAAAEGVENLTLDGNGASAEPKARRCKLDPGFKAPSFKV